MSERLTAYLDGELTPREQIQVDAHLATCPTCRAELIALRQATAALATWQAPTLAPDVTARFAAKLAARAASPRPLPRWQGIAWASAACTLLLTLVTGSLVLHMHPPPAPVEIASRPEEPIAPAKPGVQLETGAKMRDPFAGGPAYEKRAMNAPLPYLYGMRRDLTDAVMSEARITRIPPDASSAVQEILQETDNAPAGLATASSVMALERRLNATLTEAGSE
jgi:hypothetical protein